MNTKKNPILEEITKISFNNLPEFNPHRIEELQRFIDHRGKLPDPGNPGKSEKPAKKAIVVKKTLASKKNGAGSSAELNSFNYLSSHDIQEPLRKIRTFSSRILEKEYQNLSDAGKDYFQRMQNAARRMQTIIEDLTELSQIHSGERQFEKTDIEGLVEEVRNDLKETITAKNAIITSSGLSQVNVIPSQFRTVVKKLISNSLKFSKPGNRLEIRITGEIKKGSNLHEKLQPQKKYFHLSIVDNGIGFEPEFSEKIFEVFQRLHSKDEYEGNGIGLAICKKIIENHRGMIRAKGTLQEGACFDLFIPVVQN